jgi:hypothetical protein
MLQNGIMQLMHEGGFATERDYQNRWFFKRPDGRTIPSCGYHPKGMTDDDCEDISDVLNTPPPGDY